jgi:hypothetical protein
MTALINASTSSGVVVTSDTSGSLAFQSNGTSIATISSSGLTMNSGNITVASTAAPAFSASLASGTVTISSATWTKMQLNNENWDTANAYDNATNYRFQPTIAGYYQVSVSVDAGASTSATQSLPAIYKNGSAWRYGGNVAVSAGSTFNSNCCSIVYLNGSTDYVEAYAYIAAGTPKYASSFGTWFDAALIRSA